MSLYAPSSCNIIHTPQFKIMEVRACDPAVWLTAHYMDLSKRRAEAIKNILVSQFNLDAGRLTTAGFGSSKPVSSNYTPDGEAQNRPVEFVRK